MGDAVWPERSEFIGAAAEDVDFQPPNAAGFALTQNPFVPDS